MLAVYPPLLCIELKRSDVSVVNVTRTDIGPLVARLALCADRRGPHAEREQEHASTGEDRRSMFRSPKTSDERADALAEDRE